MDNSIFSSNIKENKENSLKNSSQVFGLGLGLNTSEKNVTPLFGGLNNNSDKNSSQVFGLGLGLNTSEKNNTHLFGGLNNNSDKNNNSLLSGQTFFVDKNSTSLFGGPNNNSGNCNTSLFGQQNSATDKNLTSTVFGAQTNNINLPGFNKNENQGLFTNTNNTNSNDGGKTNLILTNNNFEKNIINESLNSGDNSSKNIKGSKSLMNKTNPFLIPPTNQNTNILFQNPSKGI